MRPRVTAKTPGLRTLPTWFALMLLLWASLAAAPAHALCVGVCSCGVTTSNLLFGNINPLQSSNTDSTGSVTVSCGGVVGLLVPVTVDLSKGSGTSFANRSMGSGANRLRYNIYADSARTQVFGDTTNSTVDGGGFISLNALGLGPTVTVNLYGRVWGSQTTVVPGTYADSLTVTLTYY